jgi:two-component system response regulator
MMVSSSPPLVMLVAEDNPADVVFFNEALEESLTQADVHVVCNGMDVLRYLRRQEPFAEAPRPDVLVLDLDLPLKSGQSVLLEMVADPALQAIPVAILTTSTSETLVCETYTPGRCVYFVKTDEFRKLQEIVKRIATFARGNLDYE